MVTSLRRTVGQIHDRLLLSGLASRCASIRVAELPVLDLEGDLERTVERVAAEAERAVADDGAQVLCLGCAGMAVLAESAVRLGLRTSKVGGWAVPRPKRVTGWPITGAGRWERRERT